MDPTTIPQDIWNDCSRNAEALMVELFSHAITTRKTIERSCKNSSTKTYFD